MIPKKKSKAFTFICSFLPGAAEMYMGFMKMGLSLMIIFFASFMIPAVFNANDVFVFLGFLVWFYGFFHARNIAATDDEVFSTIEDQFIWEEFTEGKSVKISGKTGRKWIAGILILFGLGVLWRNFADIIIQLIPDTMWDDIYPIVANIPGTIIAIVIIIIGVKMIIGKKEELTIAENEDRICYDEEGSHEKEN